MYLKKLVISNFKNIKDAVVEFSPKLNCITGNNGSGKTNLLDSVYYLSMTKSYFSNLDHQSISFDKEIAFIHGEYLKEDSTVDNVSLSINRDGDKKLKKNSKSYQKFSDHIGLIPIVMVSPYDTCLINESGDERRKFLNSIISQTDKEYLRRVQNYNHLLTQRNRYLKEVRVNDDLLDTYTDRLSVNASYIYEKRALFTSKLLPLTTKYYKMLSGGKEEIDIIYRSDLDNSTLEELLMRNRERDKTLKYTSSGIQRDDLLFLMNGNPFRVCGSQGQQKTFLVSLKLAQFEILREMHSIAPLLLLDDVFDKLDMLRVEALLNMVSSDFFGQIFITDSNKVRVGGILKKINGYSKSFEILDGRLQ
jgi:DNA replication and repair protein RecF